MEKADCGGFGAAGGSWQLRRLPENVRRTPVLCMAISTTPAPGAQPHGARHRCFQVLERYTTLQCQVRKTLKVLKFTFSIYFKKNFNIKERGKILNI